MIIKKTNFKGLKVIKSKSHYDSRGFFREVFKKNIVREHNPIFWCFSKSKKKCFKRATSTIKLLPRKICNCA